MPPEFDHDESEYDSELTYDDDSSAPESKVMAKTRLSRMKRQTRPEKGVSGDLIIAQMTGNTHYPDAAEVLGAFTTANTALKTKHAALEAARQVVEEKLADAQAADAAWDLALTSLSDHVQSVSQGDLAMLQTTGLEIQAAPAPITEVHAPAKVSARTNGVAGLIKLRWSRSRGATHYVVQRATANPADEASWETLDTVSPASFEDGELASGTKYWYRIAAKGYAGLSGWSQAVCKMAA